MNGGEPGVDKMKDMRTPAITLMTNKTETNNDVTEWISVQVWSPESTTGGTSGPTTRCVGVNDVSWSLTRLSRSMTRRHALAQVSPYAFSIKQCFDTLARASAEICSSRVARENEFSQTNLHVFLFLLRKLCRRELENLAKAGVLKMKCYLYDRLAAVQFV